MGIIVVGFPTKELRDDPNAMPVEGQFKRVATDKDLTPAMEELGKQGLDWIAYFTNEHPPKRLQYHQAIMAVGGIYTTGE